MSPMNLLWRSTACDVPKLSLRADGHVDLLTFHTMGVSHGEALPSHCLRQPLMNASQSARRAKDAADVSSSRDDRRPPACRLYPGQRERNAP